MMCHRNSWLRPDTGWPGECHLLLSSSSAPCAGIHMFFSLYWVAQADSSDGGFSSKSSWRSVDESKLGLAWRRTSVDRAYYWLLVFDFRTALIIRVIQTVIPSVTVIDIEYFQNLALFPMCCIPQALVVSIQTPVWKHLFLLRLSVLLQALFSMGNRRPGNFKHIIPVTPYILFVLRRSTLPNFSYSINWITN